MFLYLSKALPPFLYPPGVSILLVLIALLIRRRRPALSGLIVFAALASLWVCSTQAASETLMRSLESQYPPVSLADAPQSDAIVVLGGYMRSRGAEHKVNEMTESTDRLWIGAKLYKAGKAPLILLTGGKVPMLSDATTLSEAVTAQELLREWGIPDQAVLLEGDSRNTRENATLSAPILAAKGAKRLILVTSAFHMPRSVSIFRKLGMQVSPFPTDYRAGWDSYDPLIRYLPQAQNLWESQQALKEWLGLAVYRIRGWA